MLRKRHPHLPKHAAILQANPAAQQEQLLLDALSNAGRMTGSRYGFLVKTQLPGGEAPSFYTFNGRQARPSTPDKIAEDWRAALESGKTTLIPGNIFSPGKLLVPILSSHLSQFVIGMSGKIGSYQLRDTSILEKIGRELMLAVNQIQQSSQLEKSFDEVIRAWAHAIELREHRSHLHQYELAASWTAEIAREVGLTENEIVHLRRGAILHDIGKMAIPETILCKTENLSPDEWDLIRRHPIFGYDIIAPIHLLNPSRDVILYHHERWDGTGYPNGLSGSTIPLAARIFSVVDVWDALICDLPYRPAWPKDMAYSYVRQQSGKQFDPAVVDAFFKISPKLNSG